MIIAITGATGRLGRLTVQALLRRGVAPADIVAAARSPAKAGDLQALGVQVREADYDRPDTLRTAFTGVDRLLLISSTEVEGRLPRHRAVIDAATAADVSLLGYTSMLHADTSPARLAVEHRETEAAIRAAGVPAVLLRNGWYLENHLAGLPAALEHGAIPGAAGNGRFSSAAIADYGEAAAAALIADDQQGRTYELAADETFDMAEFAAEASKRSGRDIAYNDLPASAYAELLTGAGLPADFAALVADADVAASRGALFDDSRTLSRLIGRPTKPWRAMVDDAVSQLRAAA